MITFGSVKNRFTIMNIGANTEKKGKKKAILFKR